MLQEKPSLMMIKLTKLLSIKSLRKTITILSSINKKNLSCIRQAIQSSTERKSFQVYSLSHFRKQKKQIKYFFPFCFQVSTASVPSSTLGTLINLIFTIHSMMFSQSLQVTDVSNKRCF